MQRVFTCKLRQVKGNKGEGREEMCSEELAFPEEGRKVRRKLER